MTTPAEQLLGELVGATYSLIASPRTRLAVTPAEYLAVREYILRVDGRFYGRVRNVPLVVAEDAAKPAFYLELADQ
jgi:hypothetical protein